MEVTNAHGVMRDEALHRARAILDGEFGAIGLVCGGSRGVILGMEEACDGSALGAGNPEVARSSVEDDLERLGGRSNGNGSDVGRVLFLRPR